MFTAGTLIGFLSLLSSPQDEKTFLPAIKKFQEDYHKPGAKDDDKIAAVNYLAQNRHERIVRVLAPLLTEGSLPVRIITARALAQFSGVDAAARELLSGLQAPANAGKKLAAVKIEILRGLGGLRCKPAAAEIAKLVDDGDVWLAKAAIDASSRIRFAEAVSPLIKALHRIEGRQGDAEISVNPLDGIFEGLGSNDLLKPDPRAAKRPSERELLREPILKALQSITKQTFASGREWDAWWQKNKSTFRVAD